MVGLHHEALLFVTQSLIRAFAAIFIIVCAVIVKPSLPGATIAFIAESFLFGITFGLTLNIAAVVVWSNGALSDSLMGYRGYQPLHEIFPYRHL